MSNEATIVDTPNSAASRAARSPSRGRTIHLLLVFLGEGAAVMAGVYCLSVRTANFGVRRQSTAATALWIDRVRSPTVREGKLPLLTRGLLTRSEAPSS